MLDDETLNLLEPYISSSYVQRSQERRAGVQKKIHNVIKEGRLPDVGFSEPDIESFMLQLGTLDSNNWTNSVGVGEREGRILVPLVRRRHFGLVHGIGRSGDVTAIQPKAPGSSVINRLTNRLTLDWLRKSGAQTTRSCFLVPMATGMTLTLCLLQLKQRRPSGARFVLWSRIDQKSCFKCMLAAGLIPIPIELRRGSSDPKRDSECADQLSCDMNQLCEALNRPAAYLLSRWPEAARHYGITEAEAERLGPDSIVCVLTTTLCFAPRVPDRLHAITKECMRFGVSHLINNAYGVQSARCMRMIDAVGKLLLRPIGRGDSMPISTNQVQQESSAANSNEDTVSPSKNDAKESIDVLYVQSTDKNLMVPVGGAIVAGFDADLVELVAKSYPGRASATPSIDVLCTLLHMGANGWKDLMTRREMCFKKLHQDLHDMTARHGLRLLRTADNPISVALDLNPLCKTESNSGNLAPLTRLGAQLFTRGCSGVRIVLPATPEGVQQQIGPYTFHGFGSHSNQSQIAYMNAAAAIGQTESEVTGFVQLLEKAIKQFPRAPIK